MQGVLTITVVTSWSLSDSHLFCHYIFGGYIICVFCFILAWQQHDVQELCRVMFDALESKFKNTDQVLAVSYISMSSSTPPCNILYFIGNKNIKNWVENKLLSTCRAELVLTI